MLELNWKKKKQKKKKNENKQKRAQDCLSQIFYNS